MPSVKGRIAPMVDLLVKVWLLRYRPLPVPFALPCGLQPHGKSLGGCSRTLTALIGPTRQAIALSDRATLPMPFVPILAGNKNSFRLSATPPGLPHQETPVQTRARCKSRSGYGFLATESPLDSPPFCQFSGILVEVFPVIGRESSFL